MLYFFPSTIHEVISNSFTFICLSVAIVQPMCYRFEYQACILYISGFLFFSFYLGSVDHAKYAVKDAEKEATFKFNLEK